MNDSLLMGWAALVGLKDKRRVLRGLVLLDELRVVLGETAPRVCCGAASSDLAIDGQVRCMVCGRPR